MNIHKILILLRYIDSSLYELLARQNHPPQLGLSDLTAVRGWSDWMLETLNPKP